MVLLYVAIWSNGPYQGHVRYSLESNICLFYSYATAKSDIHICSNKHETGLVVCTNLYAECYSISIFPPCGQSLMPVSHLWLCCI